MSAFSTYTADLVIDHILKTATWSAPAAVYAALFTSDGGLDNNTEGSQTEVSGGSYARVDVSSSFGSSSSGTAENTSEITFATATADWGTVTHLAIMDASTSGNVMMWGALSSSKLIETDDSPRFLIGALSINVD